MSSLWMDFKDLCQEGFEHEARSVRSPESLNIPTANARRRLARGEQPGRDTWPTPLEELFAEFERGHIPTVSLNRMKRERMAAGSCRVCSM